MRAVVAIEKRPWDAPDRGLSYDYYNIYLPLRDLSKEVWLFDFRTVFNREGREAMNATFRDLVLREKPDAVVVVPTGDEFQENTVEELGTICPTIAYFHDDVWRGEYARHWARYFTFVITTDPHGERKFRDAGLNNAIYSPRGYNPAIYSPDPAATQDLDVTFVGGFAPYRAWVLDRIRRAGINAQVFGGGWSTAHLADWVSAQVRLKLMASGLKTGVPRSGRVSQEEMVDIFRRSKINLNLSNSVSWDARYLAASPRNVVHLLRSGKVEEQIKGRHFEISGCGGFQLSYYVEGLEQCFSISEELAIFGDVDDMLNKLRYYLTHDEERRQIARLGLERVQRDHSIQRRLSDALVRAGVAVGPYVAESANCGSLNQE